MNRGVETRFMAHSARNAMATHCIPQLTFDFARIRRPVVARFDVQRASSDGGLPLLKALDDPLGLIAELAQAFRARRDPVQVERTVHDLLRQRNYGLACGWEDANDAARLALDRDLVDGRAVAAQPTISRFENAVDRKILYRMAEALADVVIDTERCAESTRILPSTAPHPVRGGRATPDSPAPRPLTSNSWRRAARTRDVHE